MRSGWNDELARRTHRVDRTARLTVELVEVEAEDVVARPDQWKEVVGGLVGLRVVQDGGVTLEASVDGGFAHEFEPGLEDYYPLNGLRTSMVAAAVEWRPSTAPLQEIRSIKVLLDPQMDPGTPKEAARWALDLYRVARFSSSLLDVQLEPLADTVYAAASGASPSAVEFTFPGSAPLIGGPPEKDGQSGRLRPDVGSPGDLGGEEPGGNAGGVPYPYPITVVAIRALRADGAGALNAGWAIDAANTRIDDGLAVLERWVLTQPRIAGAAGYRRAFGGPVPWITIQSGRYEAGGVDLVGDRALDLGKVPEAAVELVARSEVPAGAGVTYEVRDDGGAWRELADGDLVATDNRPTGGRDMRGVGVRQVYEMRAQLLPDADGVVAPVLRELGVRAAAAVLLEGEAAVRPGAGSGFDARTLRSEIPEVVIDVVRSGERDHSDVVTELLSRVGVGLLTVRLWWAAPDLPRSRWMLVEAFVIDDYVPMAGAISLICLSPLVYARAKVPPYDPELRRRRALAYANQPISEVFEDLVASQLGVPDRFRGAGIPASVTATVTKRIEDADGKMELDALAWLGGCAVVSSQGRVRAVDVYGQRPAVAYIRREEITDPQVGPGYRERVPEFFVPWGWNGDRYFGEVRSFVLTSLRELGGATLDAPPVLEDEVARWIDTEALANQVARRVVETLGMGVMVWRMTSTYPYPQLEPGDVVVVETDDFVAHDPIAGRELRGALWARAVVAWIGFEGCEMMLLVKRLADIAGATETVDRIGFGLRDGPEYRIQNLRITAETPDSVTYAFSRGVYVDEVWQSLLVLAAPYTVDPQPELLRTALPIPATQSEVTIARPQDPDVAVLALIPRYLDETGALRSPPGAVEVREILPAPAEPPVLIRDDGETDTEAFLYLEFEDRGIPVQMVEVDVQAGNPGGTEWRAPDRGPGEWSFVKGRVLGANQWEAQGLKPSNGLLYITPRWLAGGRWYQQEAAAFDPNRVPTLLRWAVRDGTTIIDIEGDSDTRSVRVRAVVPAGPEWWYDGRVAAVDVVRHAPTNGGDGQLSSETGSYEVAALGAPRAEVTEETLRDMKFVIVRGGDAPGEPEWLNASAEAPLVGSGGIRIALQASAAPVGYAVRLMVRHRVGDGPPTSWVDATGDVAPALAAPPTLSTAYTLATLFPRRDPAAGGGPLVRARDVLYELVIEILAGDATVKDSEEIAVGWYW